MTFRTFVLLATVSAAFAACTKPDASDKPAASVAPTIPPTPGSAAGSVTTPVASATTPSASAPPPVSAAPSGTFVCEVTKRIHTCQLSKPPCAGPCGEGMFSCPPEESPAVNATFKALADAKPAVAACGKVAGATPGTFVFMATLTDTQKGGKLATSAKSGSGPTAECLVSALGMQLPPGGDVMKRAYALEVHVACK